MSPKQIQISSNWLKDSTLLSHFIKIDDKIGDFMASGKIPSDEDGFAKGKFEVTVIWQDEEDEDEEKEK